jgi:hypothetical protein
MFERHRLVSLERMRDEGAIDCDGEGLGEWES